MEIDEFEQRLHDAEVRLARLKALYEQWFQGIERIEPQIARKELERQLELLKREQPRNTALRFRCQQLAARYGTYGIYWGRIAKQIEEGTYRRDVQRARARAERDKTREAKTYEMDIDLDGLGDQDGLDGLDGFGDSDLDAIFGALTSSDDGRPSHTHQAPKTFARTREQVSIDREPATDPAPPPPTVVPPPPGRPAPPRAPVADDERPPSSSAIAIGRMVRATPATGGVREEMGAHSRSARPPSAGAAGPPTGARPPLPPTPAGGPPTGARPPLPPGGPPTGARPPVPQGPPTGARPAVPSVPPRPAPSAGGPDLKALYERYVDARRRNNERVDNVRFESLQQSVEKMMPKLREKHGNKAIEFDVVLQDGKVGLKPKVKG